MSASAALLLLYVRQLSALLSPAAFGEAGSLLSVLLAASLPFGAVQAAIARAVAERRESGDAEGEARALAGGARLALRTAAGGALILGVGYLAFLLLGESRLSGHAAVRIRSADSGSSLHRLTRPACIAASGAALALYHAALGTLLGRRDLVPFGLAAVAEPALRILVLRALSAPEPDAALAVATCIPTAGGIGALVLRRASCAREPARIPLAFRHALGLAAYGAAAYSAPLLAAARLEDPDEVGRFFAASHVGRFLITLPLPFAMALVRRVAERRAAGRSAAPPFWITTGFLLVTLLWILGNLAFFPGWFLALLLEPGRYVEATPHLLPLGIGSAIYGLLQLPLFLGISLGKTGAVGLVGCLDAALLLCAAAGPATWGGIVAAWAWGGAAALAVATLLAMRWLRGADRARP
jgi:hypothetical protein